MKGTLIGTVPLGHQSNLEHGRLRRGLLMRDRDRRGAADREAVRLRGGEFRFD